MTPYTKQIVELHKIHKALENCGCGDNNDGGGNTSSDDITIDDVVKFIHDDFADTPAADMFPYTTWNDIPDYEDVSVGQICKTDDVSGKNFNMTVLFTPSYIIGIKGRQIG